MRSIYCYQDYRQYLREYYEECKQRNRGFSLRALASKIEINVSNVTRILSGQRNISPDTQSRIVSFLKLRDREVEYFNLLVRYCQADNSADKCAFYERIRQFKKTRLRHLGGEYDEYFSRWYNVALRELINIMSIPTTSRVLSKILVPSPSPNEVRKALNLLRKLGMIRRKPNGAWSLSEQFVSTSDDWTGTAIHSFQIAMAELGMLSLDRFQRSQRDISTLTLSLSQSGIARLKDIMQRTRSEILETANADTDASQVYQVNLQLFPLSKQVKEKLCVL